jgi:osmotically-inducible protein OsmY
VCDRLTEHGEVDARDMEVTVSGGEVTLSGTAPTRTQKRLAEDIADAVIGVIEVHNRLRVQRPMPAP